MSCSQGQGYCNQCADGAPAGEPGETLAAPGEKTWGTVDARGDESRDSAYRPGLKNVPIHPRLLVTGAALTLLLASRAAGQRLVARSAPLPLLEPGQTIRVWTVEQTSLFGMPAPSLRQVRLVGTLTAYDPPDSLSLRRSGLLVAPWTSREHIARWESVYRIDVPNGRNVLGGTAAGVVSAFGVGLMVGFIQRIFCDGPGPCGPSVLTHSARAAVVTVPVGAVVGFLSTRWKSVYAKRVRG